MNDRMNEAIGKNTKFAIYIISTRYTGLHIKKMNIHACILVTKCNLFDHYYDPRNNKGNANHNTIENTNIQDFS